MKSKIIITLVILLSFSTIVVSGKSFFKDVKSDAWYYKDVAKIQEREIMNGYQDNTFQPNKPVTRAELASVINKLMDYQTKNSKPSVIEQVIEIVVKATSSVVKIETGNNFGTGFITRHNGESNLIVTNEHVVGSNKVVTVILSNGKRYDGDVVSTDKYNDLALVKIDETDDLNYLEISADIRKGEDLLIIGHPYGLEFSLSKGVLSNIHNGYIQTDAAINAGNSGSPIISTRSEKVVGVVTSKYTGEEIDNIGFGASGKVILDFLESKQVIYLSQDN